MQRPQRLHHPVPPRRTRFSVGAAGSPRRGSSTANRDGRTTHDTPARSSQACRRSNPHAGGAE